MAGMTHPDYTAMTITQLTNAVAKLLMHTGACAKSGKTLFNPMFFPKKTGECTGPGTCGMSNLHEALRVGVVDVAGDTADESMRRAWLRDVMNIWPDGNDLTHVNTVHWANGNMTLLRRSKTRVYTFDLARQYAALA